MDHRYLIPLLISSRKNSTVCISIVNFLIVFVHIVMVQSTFAFLAQSPPRSSPPSLRIVESKLDSPLEEDAEPSEINEPITLVPADEAESLTQKLGKKPTLRYLSAPLSDGRVSVIN